MSKRIAVLVAGAPSGQNVREADIEPGSTFADLARALNLEGFLFHEPGSRQYFSETDPVFDKCPEGGKLACTPIAEVGSWWTDLRSLFTPSSSPAQPNDAPLPPTVARLQRLMAARRQLPQVTTRAALTPSPAGGRPSVRVQADTRPLHEQLGWKRQGSKLVGTYRTNAGAYSGEISFEGNQPTFFIKAPEKSGVLHGSHAACFRKRLNGWYFVHFNLPPDLDGGIVAIEKLLAESQQARG